MIAPLLIVCMFTAVIHMTECLAISMRVAGVRTKQVATSLSFVNVSLLLSRTSNLLQAPLLGAMVDSAVKNNQAVVLGQRFRYVIAAAFFGNLAGAFLVPWMVNVFERGIYRFERRASIPRLIGSALKPASVREIVKWFRVPRLSSVLRARWAALPHSFLYLNVVMVAIYAVGVLASLHAGAQLPDLRATAVQLSGIVNGAATILLAVVVDPSGAHITDQAVRGLRPEADVKAVVFYLIVGRLVATALVAQLIFSPATGYVMVVTKWLAGVLGY